MKPARIKMADGADCLAIPGVGIAVPGRDEQKRVIIGTCALLMPGMPPMPVNETLDSLEEKFGGTPPSRLAV
jgi:hypothetical protein